MSGAKHVTRYDVMPIPPVEAQTEWFRAGALTIGVEYRLVTEAIAAARQVEAATGSDGLEAAVLDDRGVSLHVVGELDGVPREVLRFDCFAEDPHYHYVSWREKSNEVLHLDPVADGDPLAWSLDRLRTRLPQMLARAGAPELAAAVDARDIAAALPRIAAAAERLRSAGGPS
jgi:hypothetical protein